MYLTVLGFYLLMMRPLVNMYLTILGFYLLMMRPLVNMCLTVLGFYLLMMCPLVNMYLTPWKVVLLMNSCQVTLSSDWSTANLYLTFIIQGFVINGILSHQKLYSCFLFFEN